MRIIKVNPPAVGERVHMEGMHGLYMATQSPDLSPLGKWELQRVGWGGEAIGAPVRFLLWSDVVRDVRPIASKRIC